jgi:hypothetical protein
MFARVATFQGDPADVEQAVARVREDVAAGPPAGLEGATFLMLVDRESGRSMGIMLFEDEEAMRRGDEALNAMNPEASGRRTSVAFYEVPAHNLG